MSSDSGPTGRCDKCRWSYGPLTKLECKRHPPTAIQHLLVFYATSWPNVQPWDWCGEFKDRE